VGLGEEKKRPPKGLPIPSSRGHGDLGDRKVYPILRPCHSRPRCS